MKRRTFVSRVAASSFTLVGARSTYAEAEADIAATPVTEEGGSPGAASESGYAPVNGLQVYYEIHGEGQPLVLLHGAFGAIGLWGPILTTLAETRRVIAIELQGHGHTADIDRPFGYEAFADDVAGVMAHLGIAQADVVGYSMGGNTALQLAIRHPELVHKIAAISVNYRLDGYFPEVLASIQELTPAAFEGTPIVETYVRSAPDPQDFPKLIERIKVLDATEFAWPREDVRGITDPTLLVYGDSDVIRPEHAVELFRLLGGGVPGDLTGLPKAQLAILPGTTHVTMVAERTDVLLTMINAFLDAPPA
jgi:pimeloyl-ACP methyl ester carboxylesterase